MENFFNGNHFRNQRGASVEEVNLRNRQAFAKVRAAVNATAYLLWLVFAVALIGAATGPYATAMVNLRLLYTKPGEVVGNKAAIYAPNGSLVAKGLVLDGLALNVTAAELNRLAGIEQNVLEMFAVLSGGVHTASASLENLTSALTPFVPFVDMIRDDTTLTSARKFYTGGIEPSPNGTVTITLPRCDTGDVGNLVTLYIAKLYPAGPCSGFCSVVIAKAAHGSTILRNGLTVKALYFDRGGYYAVNDQIKLWCGTNRQWVSTLQTYFLQSYAIKYVTITPITAPITMVPPTKPFYYGMITPVHSLETSVVIPNCGLYAAGLTITLELAATGLAAGDNVVVTTEAATGQFVGRIGLGGTLFTFRQNELVFVQASGSAVGDRVTLVCKRMIYSTFPQYNTADMMYWHLVEAVANFYGSDAFVGPIVITGLETPLSLGMDNYTEIHRLA